MEMSWQQASFGPRDGGEAALAEKPVP